MKLAPFICAAPWLFVFVLLNSSPARAQQFSAVPDESFDYDDTVGADVSPGCSATLSLDQIVLREQQTGTIVPGGVSGSFTPASVTVSDWHNPAATFHLHATLAADVPVGTGKTYSIDAYVGETTCAGGYNSDSAVISVPGFLIQRPLVSMQRAIPVNNDFEVAVSGDTAGLIYGNVSITAQGANNSPAADANGGIPTTGGTLSAPFNLFSVPADVYTSMIATWTVPAHTLSVAIDVGYGVARPVQFSIPSETYQSAAFPLASPWNVAGIIRYSQYNTPTESACSGTPATAYLVESSRNCTFSQTTLDSKFMSQVVLNGTGISLNNGILKYIGSNCGFPIQWPTGATKQNTFLKASVVAGSCNSELTGGQSVATADNPATNGTCGKGLGLVNTSNVTVYNKTIQDWCPGCSTGFNGTRGHIDSYSSVTACTPSGVGDLGNFWTVHNN